MEQPSTNNQIHLPPQEVLDVNSIERELTQLWTDTAVHEVDEDGGVIRARVLNLLVHVDNRPALNELSDMLVDITAAHPCRAIVMLGDPAGDDADIEVYLNLQCRPIRSSNDRHLCCEQVTLEASGRFAVELPSAATPLLVPDLPSILWWHGDVEFDDPVFRALCRAADRVVIDSGNFAEVGADILGFVSFFERQRAADARISDLNWTRHAAWRSLIAAFFDAPENRAQLDHLDRVKLMCVRQKPNPSDIPPQGLILAGWLASALGWKPAGERARSDETSPFRVTMDDHGRQVSFEWEMVDHTNAGACEIVAVELRSESGPDPAWFKIELSVDGNYLGTTAEGTSIAHAPRVLNCPSSATANLLTRELNAGGQDLVLERSVRAAAEIIEKMRGHGD
jgi:glucose-6-phosphate dehydrogenase assembly protein OpcA